MLSVFQFNKIKKKNIDFEINFIKTNHENI